MDNFNFFISLEEYTKKNVKKVLYNLLRVLLDVPLAECYCKNVCKILEPDDNAGDNF